MVWMDQPGGARASLQSWIPAPPSTKQLGVPGFTSGTGPLLLVFQYFIAWRVQSQPSPFLTHQLTQER